MRVRQTKQLHDAADAPRTPASAISRHPSMAPPVILKAPPHVHHDVCRLNGCNRDAAVLDVLEKLSAGSALMLGRMNGIAASLQVSTKIVQHLRLRERGQRHGGVS